MKCAKQRHFLSVENYQTWVSWCSVPKWWKENSGTYIMWRHSQAYRSTYLSWSSFYAAIIRSWCGDQSSSRGSFLLIVFEKRRTCSYLIKKADMMRIIKHIDLHLVTWSLLWISPGTLRTYHAITWAYHGNKATHVNEHLPTSF